MEKSQAPMQPIICSIQHLKTSMQVKNITFHGLRHTHASYLIYKGVSIYYIFQRLGHAN
ncbi:tyrosine-type recombinase/integrase [Levilactobacillus brevis]|uniref:tyrosine-type recombinase/integrase n=1 Tax=Levilactobacillus brevis TaxID=1580 RepID=UPI001143F84A